MPHWRKSIKRPPNDTEQPEGCFVPGALRGTLRRGDIVTPNENYHGTSLVRGRQYFVEFRADDQCVRVGTSVSFDYRFTLIRRGNG